MKVLPYFPAIDGKIAGGLEAQFYFVPANLKHRDFERLIDAVGWISNYYRFETFSR